VTGGKDMAKRNNEPGLNPDKAKVRVFFAEVEGNNESVQDALKTMVAAMSRPVRVISDTRLDGKETVLLENAETVQELGPIEEPSDTDALVEDTLGQPARKARGTGIKKDRNAGLDLVPDLNFRPDGKETLKEFFQQKAPANDLAAVVVIVYYFQHVMGLNKIGTSHVMTALKEVGKAIPADLRQTIRNVKKTRMWINFSDTDDLKMTTQGDNFVEHEMGKNGGN
jgi:hypothetical protein